jgi:hypothetical protein
MNKKFWLKTMVIAGAGLFAASVQAADYPAGYSKCADEGGTCTVKNAPNTVAYGIKDKWVYKYVTTSTVACNLATFGTDPYPGVAKKCSYNTKTQIGTATATPTPTKTATATPTPTKDCNADANQNRNADANQNRYGNTDQDRDSNTDQNRDNYPDADQDRYGNASPDHYSGQRLYRRLLDGNRQCGHCPQIYCGKPHRDANHPEQRAVQRCGFQGNWRRLSGAHHLHRQRRCADQPDRQGSHQRCRRQLPESTLER